MKIKAFKELISKLPDEEDLVIEFHSEDNEFFFAEEAYIDDDNTICIPEKRLHIKDILSCLEK